MPPRRRGGQPSARERDRCARKIHREVVASTTTLVTFGLRRSSSVAMRAPERAHHRAPGRSANGATASSIMAGSISGSSPCTFTIRSQCRSRRPPRCDRCRSDVPARSSARHRRKPRPHDDALVVGRHDHRRDRACRGGAPVDVFDHRAPTDVGEGFPRKSGRLISRRYDGDCGSCGVQWKARSWKQGARQILPQLHSASAAREAGDLERFRPTSTAAAALLLKLRSR